VRFFGVLEKHPQLGSAAVESVFSIALLMLMVLGVVEIAFTLYARNVVAASAHEGARAAIERGRTDAEARAVAEDTVRQSAGGLIDDLAVGVDTRADGDRSVVSVVVTGTVRPFGPVPLPVRLRSQSTLIGEFRVP
jgi:Flp pilus assembly protein TadG